MTRIISFWLLVAIIVAVSLLFYRVMSGFLLPLFLAAMLVVIFQPLHRRLQRWCGPRPMLAAGLATAAVVGCVFVPAAWTLSIAASQSLTLVRQVDLNRAMRQIQGVRMSFDLDLPLYEEVVDIVPLLRDLTDRRTNDAAHPAADGAAHPVAPPAASFPADRSTTLALLRRRTDELLQQVPARDTAGARSEVADIRERMESMAAALQRAAEAVAQDREADIAASLTAARGNFDALRERLPRGAARLWFKRLANPRPEQLQQWRDEAQVQLQAWLLPAANATAEFVFHTIFGAIIMVVSVFFFFADGERMTATVMRLIPLDVRHQQELLDDFADITRAVVLATIVSAVSQGVLAGIGFWFSQVESVMFLVLLTVVFSMIPFVGAMSVWIPVCLWIGVVEGRVWSAVLLAVYCAIVVSQSDNVIKPMILKGRSNIHPLLALLSVLGGVKALGPIGILVGPMVVVFLQTLLNILHREMTSLETSELPKKPQPE